MGFKQMIPTIVYVHKPELFYFNGIGKNTLLINAGDFFLFSRGVLLPYICRKNPLFFFRCFVSLSMIFFFPKNRRFLYVLTVL